MRSWRIYLTHHAALRAREMDLDAEVIRDVVRDPDVTWTNRRGCRQAVKGGVSVVYCPYVGPGFDLTVVTVLVDRPSALIHREDLPCVSA